MSTTACSLQNPKMVKYVIFSLTTLTTPSDQIIMFWYSFEAKLMGIKLQFLTNLLLTPKSHCH